MDLEVMPRWQRVAYDSQQDLVVVVQSRYGARVHWIVLSLDDLHLHPKIQRQAEAVEAGPEVRR
jgi:hypothetical protein